MVNLVVTQYTNARAAAFCADFTTSSNSHT